MLEAPEHNYSKAHNYLYTNERARLQTSPTKTGILYFLSVHLFSGFTIRGGLRARLPPLSRNIPMPSYLTSAKYLNGIHCLKRLWYEEKHPEKASPISLSQQKLLDQRKEVKNRAYSEFPEGVHIDAENLGVAVRQTKAAISRGESCLFDAAFRSNGVFVRCDILQKEEKGWRIKEKKKTRQ